MIDLDHLAGLAGLHAAPIAQGMPGSEVERPLHFRLPAAESADSTLEHFQSEARLLGIHDQSLEPIRPFGLSGRSSEQENGRACFCVSWWNTMRT